MLRVRTSNSALVVILVYKCIICTSRQEIFTSSLCMECTESVTHFVKGIQANNIKFDFIYFSEMYRVRPSMHSNTETVLYLKVPVKVLLHMVIHISNG